MKLFLAFLIASVLVSCNNKETITGNVFWKYNDFVGTKADAGATVLLYKKGQQNLYKTQVCDLMGNCKFEKIPPGKYLLVTRSKNTEEETISLVNKILQNLTSINSYFKIDLLKSYYDLNSKLSTKGEKESDEEKANTFVLSLPIWMKEQLSIDVVSNRSLDFKFINVKRGENISPVIDFSYPDDYELFQKLYQKHLNENINN